MVVCLRFVAFRCRGVLSKENSMKRILVVLAIFALVTSGTAFAQYSVTSEFGGGELVLTPEEVRDEAINQTGGRSFEDITIGVLMSPAPNVFGSPSWTLYTERTLLALQTEMSAIGDMSTDPAAYRQLADRFQPGDIMVTSFNSWRGQADPPEPFDAELGNRLHCGLAAEGDGTVQFTLADVYFSMASSDHILDYAGSLAGTTFNGTTRIGLDYGPDRIKGTVDDIYYTSGEDDATPVDAFYYVGIGNAFWPGAGNPSAGQPEINDAVDYIYENVFEITCLYLIRGNFNETILELDLPFFRDGFESGDTTAWTETTP
mgnify:CR=1 FL=1